MRMNDVGVSMLWNVKFQYSELVLLSRACHEMQVHTKCMLVAASAAQDKETYEKAVKDYNRYESLAFMFDAKMRSVADEEVEV